MVKGQRPGGQAFAARMGRWQRCGAAPHGHQAWVPPVRLAACAAVAARAAPADCLSYCRGANPSRSGAARGWHPACTHPVVVAVQCVVCGGKGIVAHKCGRQMSDVERLLCCRSGLVGLKAPWQGTGWCWTAPPCMVHGVVHTDPHQPVRRGAHLRARGCGGRPPRALCRVQRPGRCRWRWSAWPGCCRCPSCLRTPARCGPRREGGHCMRHMRGNRLRWLAVISTTSSHSDPAARAAAGRQHACPVRGGNQAGPGERHVSARTCV